jgi:F420-non-reducing hydrogenase large subunit
MKRKMSKITIDPVTRLEGHGKIDIFIDDQNQVKNAYLQVPELKGYEKFCEGRRVEDMPEITSRVCGVCREAHHIASTKALDTVFGVKPTKTAEKLRRLLYNSYIFDDHLLHLYFLGGPDYIVGWDAPPGERNILGVIKKAGMDVGKKVISARAKTTRIIEILGGKPIHLCWGVAGGVTKGINPEEAEEIKRYVDEILDFAKFTHEFFTRKILVNLDFEEKLPTYYMGLVDGEGKVDFYDGTVRVIDPDGEEFARFGDDYLDYIREHVEPYSRAKFPYLKQVGWNQLEPGKESGIYKVGPAARLNVSSGMKTRLAQDAYNEFVEIFGKPAHSTSSYIWARTVEILQAAERIKELANSKDILSSDLRNRNFKRVERGVGIVEAARGVLFHDYWVDLDGLVKKVNLIVPSTQNNPAMSITVREAARRYVHGSDVDEVVLNRIERDYRTYDPCFACATHCVPGEDPFELNLRRADGSLIKTVRRNRHRER